MMKRIAILFLIMTASLAYAADDRSVAVKGKSGVTAASKELKTALVIGNSTYITSPLKNPANDATAMAKTLRDLGFSVDERTNLRRDDMMRAIDAFGKRIKEGGVGLFYYAGHGMQVSGENYLLAVDAKIEAEEDVKYNSVEANYVLDKMKAARNGMNIVILDACRNNPFSRSVRSATQGLATMNAPSGTLIAYATGPGAVASDGTGQNGIYTQEIVKAIKKPGLKIEDAFKQVRSSVKQQTSEKQVPWEASSLEGDFYFAGKFEGGVDRSKLEGLAEGSKERQAELERLQKLEAEDAKQKEKERLETAKRKQKEQAEIAKKEKELAALDTQIAAMKSKLGTAAAGPDDSLEKMVAMVEKKEADARKLEELRRQREEEETNRKAEITAAETKRQAEIARLKKEAEEKRKAQIEKDIANFEKITKSPFGKDMSQAAWKRLTAKYSSFDEVDKIDVGDVRRLELLLLRGISTGHQSLKDPKTGLTWQVEDDGKERTWTDAISYCKNLSIEGQYDWRLPTKEELETIVDKTQQSPAIDRALFPKTKSSGYWTSTVTDDADTAYYVNFYFGNSQFLKKSNATFVRCIR